MPRYAALLRGVSPMNLRMPDLKAALEAAGFTDVRTVISSGNAVFTAPASSNAALQKKCEAAIQKKTGRHFLTIIRPVAALKTLLAHDAFASHRLLPADKRLVTFLRDKPKGKPLKLPITLRHARILEVRGGEIYSVYQAGDASFMGKIEGAYGKDVTTRTWGTVEKLAK